MKERKKSILLYLCLCLFFFADNVKAIVEFSDDNFKQCIIDNLNRENIEDISNRTASSDITESEINALRKLNCTEKNIEKVENLDKFIGLTELYLSNNNLFGEVNMPNASNLKQLELISMYDIDDNDITLPIVSNDIIIVSV